MYCVWCMVHRKSKLPSLLIVWETQRCTAPRGIEPVCMCSTHAPSDFMSVSYTLNFLYVCVLLVQRNRQPPDTSCLGECIALSKRLRYFSILLDLIEKNNQKVHCTVSAFLVQLSRNVVRSDGAAILHLMQGSFYVISGEVVNIVVDWWNLIVYCCSWKRLVE